MRWCLSKLNAIKCIEISRGIPCTAHGAQIPPNPYFLFLFIFCFYAYFRLGYVCPGGLKPPTGARNRLGNITVRLTLQCSEKGLR